MKTSPTLLVRRSGEHRYSSTAKRQSEEKRRDFDESRLSARAAVAGTTGRSVYSSDEQRGEREMVLIYESDPLDDEHARGKFYHVCQGRVDRTPLAVPQDDRPYECGQCGIDLETEDFLMALQKGSV